MLQALEAVVHFKAELSVKLPPSKTITKLWPASETAVALPHSCQTTVGKASQAFMLILELCTSLELTQPWLRETSRRLQRLAKPLEPSLRVTQQWAAATGKLLNLPNACVFLRFILGRAVQHALSFETQRTVANVLLASIEREAQVVNDELMPVLQLLARADCFNSLHEDLRTAVAAAICRLCKREDRPGAAQRLYKAVKQDNVMTDGGVEEPLRRCYIARTESGGHMRQRKRRRIHQQERQDPQQQLIQRNTGLLVRVGLDNLSPTSENAATVYDSLTEDEQCAAWEALADMASSHRRSAIEMISKLIELPQVQQRKRPRMFSMLAIRACVQTSTDSTVVDIGHSAHGRMCLRSLHSSLRELRVAAGQTLTHFLRAELPSQLRQSNIKTALEYLRALSDRDMTNEQETLVDAWAQVALQCDGRELNIALLRLVDYLGHPNPLICGVAFAELERLAEARSQIVEDMLKPFWNTIAVSVVNDLQARPQKAQQLCDLMEISIKQFLSMTQVVTIPSLVLAKRSDILQRIANAHARNMTVRELCLQPKTILPAILALLLAQPGPEVEDSALACLQAVDPQFDRDDFGNLVKVDSTLVACNMLKYIGDQTDKLKLRAYQAFQIFASIAERRPGQSKSHSRSSRTVGDFFETHILGIMTHFSDVLENAQNGHPAEEKLRCVRAIAEMVRINKHSCNIALPQIRATLQSAMDQDGLCNSAFSAWLQFISVLDSADLARVVDQSFALIIRHWHSLSLELQQKVHEGIAQLVKDHNRMIQENVMNLPSLAGIPLLAKIAAEIKRIKSQAGVEVHCKAFCKRLRDESRIVCLQALHEFVPFLEENQAFIHESAATEQPPAILSELLRAVLDVTTRLAVDSTDAAELCGKALGIIGCLDPNRIEAVRKKTPTLLLSNFDKADEVIDWAIVLLEDVLVTAFRAVNNARAQGFLAYVMQELLHFCGFNDGAVLRPRPSQVPSAQQKWMNMPEHIRISLSPFVTSRYVVTSNSAAQRPERTYPGFFTTSSHSGWLRSLVYDLMWKAKGENAQMVFPLLARVIRGHDLAIASFMLPYAMLNVVLGGTVAEVEGISAELLAVLSCEAKSIAEQDTVKLCSESVFGALDYISTWLQEKRKALSNNRSHAYRTGHSPNDFDETKDTAQVETVEKFLGTIPAEVLATRAVHCGSYARALQNWEQYIRQTRPLIPSAGPASSASANDMLYSKLQDIYAQIDEPDGLEGIAAHLPFLSEEQQAIQHAKAGRWSAAQAWYETQLTHDFHNEEIQQRLLDCLRESGRNESLLRYADSFLMSRDGIEAKEALSLKLLPRIVEAHWATGDVGGIQRRLTPEAISSPSDFNVGLAGVLVAISQEHTKTSIDRIRILRTTIAQSMTEARTSSIQASHDDLRKLHVLYEVEQIRNDYGDENERLSRLLDGRLSVLGSYVSDKQYVLSVRRATMDCMPAVYKEPELGAIWLTTAKLARQVGNTENAYTAVFQALKCDDDSAKLEEARLLWNNGHKRHAIKGLESVIASGILEINREDASSRRTGSTSTTRASEPGLKQNLLSAKAHLLLAKWLDASGQSQTEEMTDKYQFAARHFQKWEKGHYYLAKHYQKLFEAERLLPKEKQSMRYLGGDLARLVIDNYLRSILFGNKYWHQSIPKILTLWFDLGSQTITKARSEDHAVFEQRTKAFQVSCKQLAKYFSRAPAYVFYTAMPQMISRLTHQNAEVWKQLCSMLVTIISAHPAQGLWSLLAVINATDRTRVDRGTEILNRLRDSHTRSKTDNFDLRILIAQGQKLSDGLLHACEAPIEPRETNVSLSKVLGLNTKLAPNPLVVPITSTLNISLPSGATGETIRRHKAFVQDKVTIQSFLDDVLVLSSLQRPRKITIRGSDGKHYGLLCKPKDDLRKDQRLMEFNGIINRALKRDPESSKRRLYIKTYAVTPLSEESGLIEWVEGIKPIRDILLNLYGRKGIRPNYAELRNTLDQASVSPEHAHIFNDKVLSIYPATMHEWFTETYPDPETWFAARLRYARTAAVTSISGHVLGLGDRHGENILLEQSTGGVFHVDFNCLFDKGLTFEKPELVPFRLTHNMVDAMGPYGYEGPFRKSCELTYRLLRQSKDTLMTVLETFLYDPTTDFVGKKKRSTKYVPETPQEILESVEAKLKGLLKGETVPLSVEGYVHALIRDATSPFNLASMYIGWCAFL